MRRLCITALATLLAVAFVPAAADAAKPALRCHGKKATIVGTKGADTIRGTRKRDIIQARGGDDLIRGLGGNDLICSGSGRDQVSGGGGDDAIYLGRLSVAFGGPGNDRITSTARGLLDGGPGNDVMRGGAGKDYFDGRAGDDTMIDSAGDNEVYDTSGRTVVRLGSGNDFVETAGYASVSAGPGDDRVFGTGAIATGPGTDYVKYHVCTTCRSTDRFAVSLGTEDDALTLGDGLDDPTTGAPVATSIDFQLDGGTGNDSFEDWFVVGTETTVIGLGHGSVSGPWTASKFEGFENYSANIDMTGPRAFDVVGSDDPNVISIFGANSWILGAGGDDVLGTVPAGHIDGGEGTDSCDVFTGQTDCEN